MNVTTLESVTTSFFGDGAIEKIISELKNRNAKRALIVTDSFLFEKGVATAVGNVLLQAGVEYAIYYNVKPNPTVEVVNECLNAAKALDVDWLVAVGGGSSIDTSKAVSVVLANGGHVEDYEGVNKSLKKGIPIIAVNTTAGTGSEVTTFYIVTDTVKHSKMCMVDKNCKVTIAVNDTQFMKGMPKSLTAATGMDALTHAIEAALSKNANPLTDKDAYWAINIIHQYLPQAVENGGNILARDMMAYGQYVAGMAFSNAGLGMVHAMAHALGGFYNLPHGICNAVLLPFVLEYNGRYGNVGYVFKNIAYALGIEGADDFDERLSINKTIEAVRKLSKTVGITQNLQELHVNPEDFTLLAELALQDTCMRDNPVMPSKEDVVSVYQHAYNHAT